MSKVNIFNQYSLSPTKLVKSLIAARDKWRARSNEKQAKLIKQKLELRDVRRSRDKWKREAKELQLQLRELEQKTRDRSHPPEDKKKSNS